MVGVLLIAVTWTKNFFQVARVTTLWPEGRTGCLGAGFGRAFRITAKK